MPQTEAGRAGQFSQNEIKQLGADGILKAAAKLYGVKPEEITFTKRGEMKLHNNTPIRRAMLEGIKTMSAKKYTAIPVEVLEFIAAVHGWNPTKRFATARKNGAGPERKGWGHSNGETKQSRPKATQVKKPSTKRTARKVTAKTPETAAA